MPWSPIPKFPEILKDAYSRNLTKEVTFEELKPSIMRLTGLIKETTIRQTIKAMVTLGYLKQSGSVFIMCRTENGEPIPDKFGAVESPNEDEKKLDSMMGVN